MKISESPLARESLEKEVVLLEKEAGFDIHVAARDIQTDDTFYHRADELCKTASVIKLPILAHTSLLVEEGSLRWEEELTLTEAEKVAGSGVLTSLTAGLKLSIRDVCTLMMIISDNTGTNMMIERLGTHSINARMRDLGLLKTNCYRKAYTPDNEDSMPFGLGSTTSLEMLALLTLIAKRRLGNAATSEEIEHILSGQIYHDGIPRLLPYDWSYAGKTGAVDGIRNDVGVISSPDGRRFALAVFCQNVTDLRWTAENQGLLTIARIARLLLVSDEE